MARDNRKDNRKNAKDAGNENTPPEGTDFTDLLDTGDDEIEEEVDSIEKGGNEDEGENEDDASKEDAAKREADAAKAKADANDVQKNGEVDEGKAKSEELNADGTPKEKVAEKSEETEDEKKARLIEEAKAKEPTPEEKETARVAEEKRLKDIKDAEDAAKAKKAEEAPKQLTDEEAATLFKDWRTTTETLLAESHYKLTEDDVAQLNENPAAYIPRAMSRVYLDTISASFQQFVNYLPRMVYQVLEARDANIKQENSFFEKWEELNTDVGKEAVRRLGASYRQANPTASTEDWINEVGAQAMVALRITPKNIENAKAVEEAIAKPSFKPATGTETKTPEKQTPNNPFEQMANEFSMELEDAPDGN